MENWRKETVCLTKAMSAVVKMSEYVNTLFIVQAGKADTDSFLNNVDKVPLALSSLVKSFVDAKKRSIGRGKRIPEPQAAAYQNALAWNDLLLDRGDEFPQGSGDGNAEDVLDGSRRGWQCLDHEHVGRRRRDFKVARCGELRFGKGQNRVSRHALGLLESWRAITRWAGTI